MKFLLVVSVFTGGEVAHEWIKSSYPTGRLLTDYFWPKKMSVYTTRRAHFGVLHSCLLTWGQNGSGRSCSFTMGPRKKGHVDLSGPCWAKIQLLHRLRDENTLFHMNLHRHQQSIHLSSVTSRHPTLLQSRCHKGRKLFYPVSTDSTTSRLEPGTKQTFNKYTLKWKVLSVAKINKNLELNFSSLSNSKDFQESYFKVNCKR